MGISSSNLEFFNQNILNIDKLSWSIEQIKIFTDNLKNEKVLEFKKKNKKLFSIQKNYDLYNFLESALKKNFLYKNLNYKNFKSQNYDLIINCDRESFYSKKYFFKRMTKNYKSHAYTTIIDHKKLRNNNIAVQIFTKKGPLAFLPISNNKTSIVYSIKDEKNIDLENLIKKYNSIYKIIKIGKISSFKLQASNLRTYHHQNILAFGDLLHSIHPLAGQGFNMSIRDIKLLLDIIRFKLAHGLVLDNSVCSEFEKKIKHKNYFFSNGIDLVYEFFNLESKMHNSILSKSLQLVGKNKTLNKIFTNIADNGLRI